MEVYGQPHSISSHTGCRFHNTCGQKVAPRSQEEEGRTLKGPQQNPSPKNAPSTSHGQFGAAARTHL